MIAPTLRDVARAAGVSTASASRALAAGPGVSAGLHARIVAAAARLGYQPNLAARALVSRRSGLVAVLVQTLGDPLIAAVVEALERGLKARGYGVLLAATGESADESVAATRTLLGRGADAVVYAGLEPSATEIDLLAAKRLPWVELSDGLGRAPFTIDIGRRRGGALAARYLLDLGHRRFSVIARPDAGTREGVAAVAAESDVALVLPDPASGDGHPEAAKTAMRQLLAREAPPTAVVCGSDPEALGAMRECTICGIAVPQEVSIVGFGDWEFARHSMPSLTSVRISADAIGAGASERVHAVVEGREFAEFEATLKLVVRETTGPPRA